MIIKRTVAKGIYFEVKYVLLNRVNLNIKFLGSKIIINLTHLDVWRQLSLFTLLKVLTGEGHSC